MSYNPFRSHAADSPVNTSNNESNSGSYANLGRRNSPFSAYEPNNRENDEASPWSVSSSGTGYESLTLPPINPSNNYDQLPSFDDAQQYFDALPHLSSPEPFLPPDTRTNANSRQNPRDLPPLNQQRAPRASISQYRLAVSESPDPFEDADFIDLSPEPDDMRSTRHSSIVDLTTSPVAQHTMAPSTRKRKATTPAEGRPGKAGKLHTPKRFRPGSRGAKKELSEEVPVVDLSEVDTLEEVEALKQKEQAEMVKKQNLQNQEDATKPAKLSEFQCIICMDNPTDLSVTFCGKYDPW